MNLVFEDAAIDDLPVIVEIYNSTVAGRMVTADTTPVSVESKISWFEQHHPDRRPLWLVKNEQNEIIGWASYQDFYGRPAYSGTAELSIYLHPEQRGKGFGHLVMQYCIQQAPRLGIQNLLGYIFAHNEPSIRLFKRFGFEQWAYLPDIAELDGVKRSLIIFGKKVG